MPKRRETDDMQYRARAVCTRCHRRKVRCDRESQPSGICSRCEREGHQCQLHVGPRKEKALRSSLPTPWSNAAPTTPTAVQQTRVSCDSLGHRPREPSEINNENSSRQTALVNEAEPTLQMIQAVRFPPAVIGQALSDFYFRELFTFVPVFDRDQVELNTSALLKQSLYFAGSVVRRSTCWPSDWSPSAIYGRIKMLLFLHHDPAPLNMLSALCILGTWPISAPDAVVLDNPWQWTGMAIRLAIQLQMHDEKAHSQFAHPGRTRRIWWYLFNNDTLQMACSGRPGMFPVKDNHVELPRPSDFNVSDVRAHVFCEFTWVCKKLREVLELSRSDDASQADVFEHFHSLRIWRANLPEELHLFHEASAARRSYDRSVSELYIFYLVTIILTCFLGRREDASFFKCASVVAASQISQLHEEILYHEDVPFLLTIHAWANLVAAIPRTFVDADLQSPTRSHEMEISRMVLEKMSEKHSSAAVVQRRIDDLGHTGANVFPVQLDTCGEDILTPISDDQREDVIALFPFPWSCCPMLELLRNAGTREARQSEPVSRPVSMEGTELDWPVDWSLFLSEAYYDPFINRIKQQLKLTKVDMCVRRISGDAFDQCSWESLVTAAFDESGPKEDELSDLLHKAHGICQSLSEPDYPILQDLHIDGSTNTWLTCSIIVE